MQDVNRMFPDAHSLLFKQFHFGLPVGGYKAGETLASVSKSHSKAEGEVVNFLNAEFAKRQIALISSRELKDRLERNPPKPVLLDIREQWEWDIAYIPNSQRITRDNCESLLSGLAKDAEIVLIDWKQDRGPDFSRWLSQRGFTQVKCLEGGIDDWAAKVEPQLARYDIDEDDGYRYEDIIEGHAPDGHP
ncbi:MAG: hypothetical protein COV67_00275 [Nitrospinae bacterium CG11_big_fil_rev_8_21_14_0_20_56_8]|nr:MAG: hypothetical protein COV67_00275 [Nitrospinae bacterium CG11_big_fil_rev_8_21_14_0_20_56_8]